mgnify:CR=1 FL=1
MRWLAHLVAAVEVGCLVVHVVRNGVNVNQGWAGWSFLLMMLVVIAVGWLLASRLPGNPLGWILLGFTGGFALGMPLQVAGQALMESAPAVASWLLWYGGDREDSWIWLPPLTLLFIHLPLRFPDGKLPSPRWRWFHWAVIGLTVVVVGVFSTLSVEVYPGLPNPVHSAWVVDNLTLLMPLVGLLLASALVATFSLVQRYRNADGLQRTQIRWVVWAACLVFALYFVALVVVPDVPALQSLAATAYGLIPAAIGVAVLRFRLYQIDRVISRTVSYVLVTGVVLGVYALTVTAVSQLLPGQSSLAVAAATLAAATLFLPVLRRVQRVVDRRFDREHFDAEQTVDAFGERLRAGLDPRQTTEELAAAVQRTLQPARMGIWVRE